VEGIVAHGAAAEERRWPSVCRWASFLGSTLLIVAGGVLTGILAGLFGIGGGGIIVPILYEVFRVLDVPEEVRLQLCVFDPDPLADQHQFLPRAPPQGRGTDGRR
jgi:hypothetical protein